ncbi:MFS transporter [Thermopolyspora flexuosa]|uniref:Putative MFS family arabinose efflux permease n=1 Tax=Thermopolyspora flexuosa TaxID=103836 RepID=A0A543J2R3_9ACTN|nr:MFS transporter [Thermopolyspora flexuosa]TQM77115.1 putative MFS family arabinose efflux permease [Thermopolyspora flexuosa]GGM76028.1 MFS transporter [Thermopolyspora flexuosa]
MPGLQTLLRRVAIDLTPLRRPHYRRLWAGQGLSFIGFQLTTVAVNLQVFDITGSSLWVGMLGLANLVPLIVFGLWGGAVADVMDRRRLLVTGAVITWIATLVVLLQAWVRLGNVYVILAAIAVQSMGFAITSATRGAIIPRIVPIEKVPAANTLNFLVSSLGSVLGPLLAGVVLARGGYTLAYLIDAVLFSASFYAAVRLPHLPPLGEASRRAGLGLVAEGLRYIATSPVVLMSFVVDLIAMVFAMPRALYPELTEVRFGDSPHAYAWLSAAIAIGAVAGGLFTGWVGRVRRQGLALTFTIAVWGLTVAAAGLVSELWLVVTLLAVGGVADLISATWRQSILQLHAPDEMRGRLQGVFMVVVAGGPRLGDLRAGASASLVGLTPAWVSGGLICAVLVVVTGLAVRSFREYVPETLRRSSPSASPDRPDAS